VFKSLRRLPTIKTVNYTTADTREMPNRRGGKTKTAIITEREQEKINTIEGVLASTGGSLGDGIWEPTENDLALRNSGDNNVVTAETVQLLEDQLNEIYDLEPEIIQVCYSEGFKKRHRELAERVHDMFSDRRGVMKTQHEIAQLLLPHRYPMLHAVAAQNGVLKSTQWEQMRQRLSLSG
jgi:hypothetical protein